MIIGFACAAVLAFFSAAPVQTAADALSVRDAWVRESTPTRTISSGYLTIENRTAKPQSLVRVAVEGAGTAQIHATIERDGQATMREVPAVQIPAHGSVSLTPGGTHLMLLDITRPLRTGSSVTMTLTFGDGQTRKARAVVRPLSAMAVR